MNLTGIETARQLHVSSLGEKDGVALIDSNNRGLEMKMLLPVVGLAVMLGATVPAFAADVCNVPAGQAQTTDALKAQLEKEGWTVRKIKHQKGCYEAYAVKGSERMEKLFDPVTLKMLDVAAD